MSYLQLTLNSRSPLNIGAKKGKSALSQVANHLAGYLCGAKNIESYNLLNLEGATGLCTRAAAVLKMATGTGTVGCVINGTTCSDTWATSDTVAQGLVVAAVNADATVAALGIKASQYVAVLTLSSADTDVVLNIFGHRFTAVTDFAVSGTDNADAVALCAAINARPGLNAKCAAVPDASAGVAYIGLLENRAARSDEKIIIEAGTGVTVTSQLAAAAYSLVYSRIPGAIGNACTFTATGTNVTAHSAVSGKLGGGVSAAATNFLTSDMR